MKDFFIKLFFGKPNSELRKPNPFYRTQKNNLQKIWDNTNYNDFGVERLFRLFLQLITFILPAGVVRSVTGKSKNLIVRKLGIDFYGIAKVVFILVSFLKDWNTNLLVLFLIIYLLIDTLHFLTCRVFLSDVYTQAISYKRSLLMTFINYIEMCLCFGFVYSYLDNTHCVGKMFDISEKLTILSNTCHLTDIQAVYFSFVTSATIGYGDISPISSLSMVVSILQIIVSLFFVVVFISNTINKLGEDTYFNKNQKNKEK